MEMQETVEVCLGVTGLRGGFSHRVVSEALRMLRPLWVTFFILQMSQSHVRIALLTCCSVFLVTSRPENVSFVH